MAGNAILNFCFSKFETELRASYCLIVIMVKAEERNSVMFQLSQYSSHLSDILFPLKLNEDNMVKQA